MLLFFYSLISYSQDRPRSSYDPMTSWDGLSEDSKPFSRLEHGARVVLKEQHPTGGLLGTVATQKGQLPRCAICRSSLDSCTCSLFFTYRFADCFNYACSIERNPKLMHLVMNVYGEVVPMVCQRI